jgi:hypothetical protein
MQLVKAKGVQQQCQVNDGEQKRHLSKIASTCNVRSHRHIRTVQGLVLVSRTYWSNSCCSGAVDNSARRQTSSSSASTASSRLQAVALPLCVPYTEQSEQMQAL